MSRDRSHNHNHHAHHHHHHHHHHHRDRDKFKEMDTNNNNRKKAEKLMILLLIFHLTNQANDSKRRIDFFLRINNNGIGTLGHPMYHLLPVIPTQTQKMHVKIL